MVRLLLCSVSIPPAGMSHWDFWSRCPWVIRIIKASLFQTWATSYCQHQASLGASCIPLAFQTPGQDPCTLLHVLQHVIFGSVTLKKPEQSPARAKGNGIMKYVPLFSLGLLPCPNVVSPSTYLDHTVDSGSIRTDSIYPCSLFYCPLNFMLTLPPFPSGNLQPKASFHNGTYDWTVVHS